MLWENKQTNKHVFLFVCLVLHAGNIFLWKYSFAFIFPFIKPFALSEKQSDVEAHQQLKKLFTGITFVSTAFFIKILLEEKKKNKTKQQKITKICDGSFVLN